MHSTQRIEQFEMDYLAGAHTDSVTVSHLIGLIKKCQQAKVQRQNKLYLTKSSLLLISVFVFRSSHVIMKNVELLMCLNLVKSREWQTIELL